MVQIAQNYNYKTDNTFIVIYHLFITALLQISCNLNDF